MSAQARAIEAYLRAKDENRPVLMQEAFDAGASLAIVVTSGAITFPPSTQGREAITDVLVREFGATWENVRTLCLSPPPRADDDACSCRWLVGMSSKADRTVRVGVGRYDWRFRAQEPRLVSQLTITSDAIQALAPEALPVVAAWLHSLPWPWCPLRRAFAGAPRLPELAPLLARARDGGRAPARATRRREG